MTFFINFYARSHLPPTVCLSALKVREKLEEFLDIDTGVCKSFC